MVLCFVPQVPWDLHFSEYKKTCPDAFATNELVCNDIVFTDPYSPVQGQSRRFCELSENSYSHIIHAVSDGR